MKYTKVFFFISPNTHDEMDPKQFSILSQLVTLSLSFIPSHFPKRGEIGRFDIVSGDDVGSSWK